MKRNYATIIFLGLSFSLNAQVAVKIDADKGNKVVSPYLYGKNSGVADDAFDDGEIGADAGLALFEEAGLRFTRQNHGNNLTKYNWMRKISSHPDWYNNVYSCDWENAANVIAEMPNVQGMYGFQLCGYVANNANSNFADWDYNKSAWWEGCNQNLAGGGVPNTEGGTKAAVDGDYTKYLMNWPADSTVAILDHWKNDLNYDLNAHFRYWSMDNEPELWGSTHDDLPLKFTTEEFIEKYVRVAKMAREKYPDIKLCGPVTANEWQWFKWGNESIYVDGKYYCWLEYFIKRIAEEQKASGVRLLDVFDLHWYPTEMSFDELMQCYRVFFDKTYDYPIANGLNTINGGWDTSSKRVYIFARANEWLDKYFGKNHGITLALTETAIPTDDANDCALVYASLLGDFMKNGVEILSPWTWKTGMWETVHLYSRYSKEIFVESSSSDEEHLSAYTTVNAKRDSMTIVLVNRSKMSQKANVSIDNIEFKDDSYKMLTLSDLPDEETFISHEENALKESSVDLASNSMSITLPARSITAVVLGSKESTGVESAPHSPSLLLSSRTNGYEIVTSGCELSSFVATNALGQVVAWGNTSFIETTSWMKGVYAVKANTNKGAFVSKIIVQ